jgi:hypothetical protein
VVAGVNHLDELRQNRCVDYSDSITTAAKEEKLPHYCRDIGKLKLT